MKRSHSPVSSSSAVTDFVVEFSRVRGSSLSSATSTVQWSVEGATGFDMSDPTKPVASTPGNGEGMESAEVFGALGIVGRPLPPDTRGGANRHAEVICLKTADGLVPIATRDIRLTMQGAGPKPGSIGMVGYGGGFVVLSPVAVGTDPAGGGTIMTVYCPYDFDAAGIAAKAHSVTLDPSSGNESISVVHADGMAVLLANDTITLKSKSGTVFIEISDSEIILGGAVKIAGSLGIGTALAGPIFPVVLVGAPPNAALSGLSGGPSAFATSSG